MTPTQRSEAKASAIEKIKQLQTERMLKVEWQDRLMKDMDRARAQISEIEAKMDTERALIALIDATA